MSLFSEHPGLKRVPDFTGLDHDAAQALAARSGWRLRQPDPDAPPISTHWAEHRHLVVASQDPGAGHLLRRGDGVAIALTEPPRGTTADIEPDAPPALRRDADERTA